MNVKDYRINPFYPVKISNGVCNIRAINNVNCIIIMDSEGKELARTYANDNIPLNYDMALYAKTVRGVTKIIVEEFVSTLLINENTSTIDVESIIEDKVQEAIDNNNNNNQNHVDFKSYYILSKG